VRSGFYCCSVIGDFVYLLGVKDQKPHLHDMRKNKVKGLLFKEYLEMDEARAPVRDIIYFLYLLSRKNNKYINWLTNEAGTFSI